MRWLLIIPLLISCQVRYSFNGGSVPAEADTFSVEYFNVVAPLADPNYGQQLSEAYRDLLQGQTRLSIASASGDIHYEGVVSRYDIQPVAASGEETTARNRLTIEVKINYFNRLEPDKDKQLTIMQFEDFEAGSDFESVEDDLVEAINEKLLQDIFDRTLGDW